MPHPNRFPGMQLNTQLASNRADRNLRLGLGIKESRRAEVINRFERAKAQEEADKRAKESQKGGFGGLIGTGVGAGIGALLALPTGGLSVLAGTAIGAAVGGVGGSALDRPGSPNPGPAVSGAFGAAAGATTDFESFIDQIDRPIANSPFFPTNPNPSSSFPIQRGHAPINF